MGKKHQLIQWISLFIFDRQKRKAFRSRYLWRATCPAPPYGYWARNGMSHALAALVPFRPWRRKVRKALGPMPLRPGWEGIAYRLNTGDRTVILAREEDIPAAERLQRYLEESGIPSDIIHSVPKRWKRRFHFVISPQHFAALPPCCAVVQHGAAPYGDEAYRKNIAGAVCILSDDAAGLEHLRKQGIPFSKLYYLPQKPAGETDECRFFFMRFLLAFSVISFDTFYDLAGKEFILRQNRVCLGLPETVQRRLYFENEPSYRSFQYFPGLRHVKGWIGCGFSYKFLMTKAKETDFETIAIAEDDVEFPVGWDARFAIAQEYLRSPECGKWHVFASLVAEIHPKARCSKVSQYRGERYVHLDKMVSTVLNVYHRSFFDILSEWNERNDCIDRYIESCCNLSVVVPEPFMIGHLDNLASTLWNNTNMELYSDYFDKSRSAIKEIADIWVAEHQHKALTAQKLSSPNL